jgi:hypothetical protein
VDVLELIVSLVVGVGAIVVAFALFVFMLRTLSTTSRKVYWRNIGILAVIGTTAIIAAPFFMPHPNPAPVEAHKSLPAAPEPFAGMSYLQIGLLFAAAATMAVGGNLVGIRSARRAGRPWWQALNPLNPPFRDFTHADVASLGAVAFVALGLAMWALSMNRELG